jgi:hypothetical protein
MFLVLFVILVLSAVALSMTALVISQTKPTQFARKNARTVNAAATGLQVAVDQLRAANDGAGNGSLLLIPCTGANDATLNPNGVSGTADGVNFTGAVSNLPGSLTYRVSVAYYLSDPSGKDLSWLQTNAMSCPLTAVPAYAYLQSTGLGAGVPGLNAASGNRGVHAIYQFKTANTNVQGGRMIEFGTTTPQMCLDSGTVSPIAGANMTMQPCQAIGTPQQTWLYRNDLSIKYGGNPTLDLCVQASQTTGTRATLQPCFGTGSGSTYPITSTAQAQQEWSFNDSGHFAAPQTNGSGGYTGNVSGICIDPAGASGSPGSGTQAATGAFLVVVTCDGITTGYNAWNPDPAVGAGKAAGNVTGKPGAPTNQLVNYAEFGRCLDVTGQNYNADHLIDYPCKQAPDASLLTWNQLWTYTDKGGGYGTVTTVTGGVTYCLTAPAQTAANNWVTIVSCSTPTNAQLWQATGKINGDYTHSYELVSKSYLDSGGLGECLSVDKAIQNPFGSSTIIVEPCDGTLEQKWNAPPVVPVSGLGNIQEQAGGQP